MSRGKEFFTFRVGMMCLAFVLAVTSVFVYLTHQSPTVAAPTVVTAPVSSREITDDQSRPTELPSNWPQEVPVPQGRIIASSGLALSMVLDGPYDQVVQSIRSTYVNHGFTERPEYGLEFENTNYAIAIALENRDHSAVSSNASLVVTPK
jgi:hypothetical protein